MNNVNPIAYLAGIAIHRQRLAGDRIGDHQWQKLFGKLIRPELLEQLVVAAGGTHSCAQGTHQVIRSCLGGGVGTVRSIGNGLLELLELGTESTGGDVDQL